MTSGTFAMDFGYSVGYAEHRGSSAQSASIKHDARPSATTREAGVVASMDVA